MESYIQYYDNIINNKKEKKFLSNIYSANIANNDLNILNDMYQKALEREQNFYNVIKNKNSIELSGDMIQDIKAYLKIRTFPTQELKNIFSKAITKKIKESTLESNIRSRLKEMYDIDVEYRMDKGIRNTIKKEYNAMSTRYANNIKNGSDAKQSLTIEFNDNGDSIWKGETISTLEGLLIEIGQGLSKGYFTKRGTISSKKQSVVGDYIVDEVGIDEIKRGLASTPESSEFHIGGITSTSLKEGGNWSSIKDIIVDTVTNIIINIRNTSEYNEIQKLLYYCFDTIILNYLRERLLNSFEDMGFKKDDNSKIFYFESDKGIMLASEFIAGIRDRSQLMIRNSEIRLFENNDEDKDIDINQIRLDITSDDIRVIKDLIKNNIGAKNNIFYGRFNLYYIKAKK